MLHCTVQLYICHLWPPENVLLIHRFAVPLPRWGRHVIVAPLVPMVTGLLQKQITTRNTPLFNHAFMRQPHHPRRLPRKLPHHPRCAGDRGNLCQKNERYPLLTSPRRVGDRGDFGGVRKVRKIVDGAGRGLDRPFAREYNILSENSFPAKRRLAAGELRREKQFEM